MSEKMYLLTEQDIARIVDEAACAGSAFDSIDDIPNPEWLEAHEHRERTCRMVDNGVELCCSECDRRHSYDDEPQFCMGCGAKVER